MPEIKAQRKTTLKHFVRKKMCYAVITNILFNTGFAYLCFHNFSAIHLFEGSQNMARLMLPMSFLLPFMLTFDMLKKTMLHIEQGTIDIVLNEELNKNRFIFQMATINGFCTLLPVFVLMVGLQFSLPEHYNFNVLALSVVDGLIAGLYSVIFTYLPIKKLKKHLHNRQVQQPVAV
jgi:hypothetical protein